MEIIKLTEKLHQAINNGNYETYSALCSPDYTCFDPGLVGNLMRGTEYQRFQLDFIKQSLSQRRSIIYSPHVVYMSDDSAYIAYTCLTYCLNGNGPSVTIQSEETRVWRKSADGVWKNTHSHRSENSTLRN